MPGDNGAPPISPVPAVAGPGSASKLAGEPLARACARYADDKKAADIAVLDVRGLASFTDYLVVCGATSEPHLKAVASGIADALRSDHGIKPYRSDGLPASAWLVLDFVDVVVHIFREDTRAFYGLEDLWNDAARLHWEGRTPAGDGAPSEASNDGRQAASKEPPAPRRPRESSEGARS